MQYREANKWGSFTKTLLGGIIMLNVPGGRHGHNRIQHNMDLARRAEAKRRRDEGRGGGSGSGGIVGNLVGLAFGLAVLGFVLFMAWKSGLIG